MVPSSSGLEGQCKQENGAWYMWRKEVQLCESQWQLLAWKGLATEQSRQKAKFQAGSWGEGGMTNHHKALQRYVFGMVAILPVSTLPVHTGNLWCHDLPHAFSCPLLISLIDLSITWWLVIYLSNMSSCIHFTSFSVDTMKQSSHTNKTETTGNFSQTYPIQAVTRLVWNCIYVNTDTWFIP